MKIVLAPQSFKKSFSCSQVIQAYEEGVKRVFPSAIIVKKAVGDGGDGTLEALFSSLEGVKIEGRARDALGREKIVAYGDFPMEDFSFIETASICGVASLSDEEKNPLTASSYGVGEAIKMALCRERKKLIIGLGGSATNDGGCGLLSALGVKFFDRNGAVLPPGGAALADLFSVDIEGLDKRAMKRVIIAACDVKNPLLGEKGATRVYSIQKGATKEQEELLEQAMKNFVAVTKSALGIDMATFEYGGASGGIAAGLFAYLGATLTSGVDLILDTIDFDRALDGADLLLTGEGRIDDQTLHNKGVLGICRRAKKRNIPVIAVVGEVGMGYEAIYREGLTALSAAKEAEGETPYDKLVHATVNALKGQLQK